MSRVGSSGALVFEESSPVRRVPRASLFRVLILPVLGEITSADLVRN